LSLYRYRVDKTKPHCSFSKERFT